MLGLDVIQVNDLNKQENDSLDVSHIVLHLPIVASPGVASYVSTLLDYTFAAKHDR